MCGIAGIIGRIDDANRSALTRMEQAMAHRGPNSTGLFTSTPDADGNGVLLAHRRLSILDLSNAAYQPMTDAPSGQTIIFNGEIYNYRQLREELQAAGETFRSTGDTEVMLRVLIRQGAAGLPKLRGMFAFALWDEKARSLLLARDPLGIKPLYIARNPDVNGTWTILFASEVRSVLASGLLKSPKLDPVAVASVLWNGYVVAPNTAVQGVESMWPGESRSFDARGKQTAGETYWSIPSPAQCDGTATRDSLHETLKECVALHLDADVPLGVFLSGGIDSSAVANLAQQAVKASGNDQPVNTFTITFSEAEFDESVHAAKVAKAIGTSHREIPLTEAHFVANLDRAIESLDQPTFDGLNSWFVSHAVREAGLTVALAGTGGDELFGGYKSFRDLPTMHKMNRRSRFVPKGLRVLGAKAIAKAMHGKAGAVAPQTRWAKLPDMVRAGEDLLGLYQLAYALFLPDFQDELFDRKALAGQVRSGLPAPLAQRVSSEAADRSALATISVMEQRCFLGERLLRDTDAASMAVSLEVRVPLVDQALLEHVMRLPDDVRYQPLGRKQALRDAGLRGLDPAMFERPKSGFVLPFDTWIRKNLGKAMDETMRDPSAAKSVGMNGDAVRRLWSAFQSGAPGMYWSRAWAIYVLMRWAQRHGVMVG